MFLKQYHLILSIKIAKLNLEPYLFYLLSQLLKPNPLLAGEEKTAKLSYSIIQKEFCCLARKIFGAFFHMEG